MIRPGYLKNIDSKKLLPKVKLGKPLKTKAFTGTTDSVKNAIKGVISVVSTQTPKTLKIQETKILPGMSKEEFINAPKKEELTALPEIKTDHPLHHDLTQLQTKLINKQKEKFAERKNLSKKWSKRPETLYKWHKEDEVREAIFTSVLDQWDAEDKTLKEQRNAILNAIEPRTYGSSGLRAAEAQKQLLKNKWSEEDARTRGMRLYELIKKEDENIERLKKREKKQKRADWLYNIFRPLYGWGERKIPN